MAVHMNDLPPGPALHFHHQTPHCVPDAVGLVHCGMLPEELEIYIQTTDKRTTNTFEFKLKPKSIKHLWHDAQE